jgi:hypothetical protein
MPENQGTSDTLEFVPRTCPILPQVVTTVNGSDKVRTHFTFTNIGLTPVFSVSVDTVRQAEYTMDFETIDELRPGASLTCLAIIHPVMNNDPHWTFEFWSDSGDEFTAPFVRPIPRRARAADRHAKYAAMESAPRVSGSRQSAGTGVSGNGRDAGTDTVR